MRHQLEEIMKKASDEARQASSKQIEDLKKSLAEEKEKSQILKKQELELLKKERSIEEKIKDVDLIVERKLRAESKTLEEQISKRMQESFSEKEKAKDIYIENLKKSVEEANRKAGVGSQQLQGEVLELTLQDELQKKFSTDEIGEIGKGVEGGDISHTVKDSVGNVAGVILWETKKTKNWSNSWLGKLREDTREAGASISVLVTQALPKEIDSFGVLERVFVSAPKYALNLAVILRGYLLGIASAKLTAEHKDEKLEHLFRYLTSDNFRHKFEAQVESIVNLKDNLETEKRSIKRIWKQRDLQIERLMNNTSNMYTELQGIAGQDLLPTLKKFELPSGDAELIDG